MEPLTDPTAPCSISELKRILFVDDDPGILSALEAMLRKDRRRWEMVFALGGARAVDAIRTTPFDVVVSDMRMPEVDGVTVIHEAMDACPATVRIMLTGYASNESIMSLLPSLHQLISKPCDAKTLRGTIERSLDGFDAARDASVRALIGGVTHLPAPPDTFFELSRLLQSPTAGVNDVAKVVMRDPALSAKLLQLANSSYFGSGQGTKSIQQAIAMVGIAQLRCIALSTTVLSAPKGALPAAFSIGDLQRASLRTAALARAFAEPEFRDEAFASGLLHHLGPLVIALSRCSDYGQLHQRVHAGEDVLEAESSMFGASHVDVGAQLLAIWGLPTSIVDAVRFHHDPASAPESSRQLASIVHGAAALAGGAGSHMALNLPSLARAGCAHLVETWRATAGRADIG
jgi:HD-like signal output (HDOD) protein/ActR/RegA family two-component response regulator